MARLKERILDVLAKSPDEKEYVAATRKLSLLKRLFSLEMTRSEYEELRNLPSLSKELAVGLQTTDQRPETKTKGLQSSVSSLQSIFADAVEFYETAIVRENKMFANALKKMDERKEKNAVIVTGGFHAEGLKKLAASQGCAYMQVTPRINEISKRDHEIYLRSIFGARDFESSQMGQPLIEDASMRQILGAKLGSWLASIRELVKGLINSAPVLDRASLSSALSNSSLFGNVAAVRSEVRASQTFLYEAHGVRIHDPELSQAAGQNQMAELGEMLEGVDNHKIASNVAMQHFAEIASTYPRSVRQALSLEISSSMQSLEEDPSGNNETELNVLRAKRRLLSEPESFATSAIANRSEVRKLGEAEFYYNAHGSRIHDPKLTQKAGEQQMAALKEILEDVDGNTIQSSEAMIDVAKRVAEYSPSVRKALAAEVLASMDVLESGALRSDKTQREVLVMQHQLLTAAESFFITETRKAASRSEVRQLKGSEFYYNAHGIEIHDPKLTQKAGEQQMAELKKILEDVDGNTIRSRQAMIDVAKRVAEYSLSARKALSAKVLASRRELGSGASPSDKTQIDVLAEQYLILIRPDSFFMQETKTVAHRPAASVQAIKKAFGAYKPFSVEAFASHFKVTAEDARKQLEKMWRASDNMDRIKKNGAYLYLYSPISVAVQIGPDVRPEDVADAARVVINHSETKEFLGVTAESARKQLDEFLAAGFKVVLAFGDFPVTLTKDGKTTDFEAMGLRKFPTDLKAITDKFMTQTLKSKDRSYETLRKLYQEAEFIREASIDQLIGQFGEYLKLFDFNEEEFRNASDLTASLKKEHDLKAKIISEISTKTEIEYEIGILFSGLKPEDVRDLIKKAYEPIEGIKTVAISEKLAEFRRAYTVQAIAKAAGMSEDQVAVLYGGGGNVKNFAGLKKAGYGGAFIGRASALAKAEPGKDSTANISFAAQETGERLTTIYNAKSTRAPSPAEYMSAYAERGVNTESGVKIIHAVSRLDYRAWQRELSGEKVSSLFEDVSQVASRPQVTIVAGATEATQGIGAYTAHIPAEFLREAGVTQALVDRTKPYAVKQTLNLINAGITPVVYENWEGVAEFFKALGEENLGSIVEMNTAGISGLRITPINALRQFQGQHQGGAVSNRSELRAEVLPEAKWIEIAADEVAIKRAFGTNGIRSDDIEIDGQRRIAAGTADVLAAQWRKAHPGTELPWVMVGFDPRPQGDNGFTPGEMSESKAVAEVFAAYGFKVLFVPKAVAAPFMISASGENVHPRDIFAAVMRTASHNEVVDPKSGKLVSGFKLFMWNAPAADSFTGLISAKINDAEFSKEVPVLNFDQAVIEGKIVVSKDGDNDDPDTVEFRRMQKAFDLKTIGDKIRAKFPAFKIALNTMNGGMSQFGPRVLRAMGIINNNKGFLAFNTKLMNDPSMKSQMLGWVEYQDANTGEMKRVRFAPDPTRAWMRGKDYQDFVAQDPMKTLALLIDGDADRLVAELGKEIIPNEIGMLAAYYLAKYKGQKGHIVRTVPTTGGLDALAQALGLGKVDVTPVGSKWFAGPNKYYDSNLNDVLVAVEESGHIVFNKKGQLFFDHSIGLATLMLEMMAETGKTWQELSDEMWAFIEEKTGQKRIATVRDGISKEDGAENYYALALRLGNPSEDTFRREFATKMEATLAKAGIPWKVTNMDIADAGGAQLQFEGGRKVFPRKSGTDGSVRLYGEVLDTERDLVPVLMKSMREVMDFFVSAQRSEMRKKTYLASAALGIPEIGKNLAYSAGAALRAVFWPNIIDMRKQGKNAMVRNDIPSAKGGAVSSKRSEVREGVLPRVDTPKTPEWKQLRAFAKEMKKKANALRELFRNDPERVSKLTMNLREDVAFDFSKQRITGPILDTLVALAERTGVSESIEKMFTGARINETENRAVLHVALRNVKRDPESGKLVAANGPIFADGKDVMPGVIQVLEQMEAFVQSIHSGTRVGYTKKKIKNIVNMGIGGSDLGGKMATRALIPYQFKRKDGVNVYYVSNVDGTDFAEVVKNLDPEETMFVIASKTFTTAETMQNARSAKDWILRHYGVDTSDQKKADAVVNAHFIALSTAAKLVQEFGITPDEEHMFPFWDWVGGRYSVWSAIGLPLATYIGFDNFLKFLEGARYVDEHFRTKPLRENIPVIKALLNIWNGNFLGARSFAVLPYDQYLSLFPEFAQQFFMESNGKIASRLGRFVRYITGLILWGAAGTNGQHSFYQLLHQGTHLIPADFIGVLKTHNPLPGHHEELFSNVPAQTEALAFGATKEEVKALLEKDLKYKGQDIDWHAAQQTFPGNKPTTTIALDEVNPETLGMLVALYEHQIFVESVVLNIFAFDQWGVQLGKKVALKVRAFLTGERPPEEIASAGISASGEWLIRRWLTRGGGSQAGVESQGGAVSEQFETRQQESREITKMRLASILNGVTGEKAGDNFFMGLVEGWVKEFPGDLRSEVAAEISAAMGMLDKRPFDETRLKVLEKQSELLSSKLPVAVKQADANPSQVEELQAFLNERVTPSTIGVSMLMKAVEKDMEKFALPSRAVLLVEVKAAIEEQERLRVVGTQRSIMAKQIEFLSQGSADVATRSEVRKIVVAASVVGAPEIGANLVKTIVREGAVVSGAWKGNEQFPSDDVQVVSGEGKRDQKSKGSKRSEVRFDAGREPSPYGPDASQEGLRPLYERIAWAREHAPSYTRIKRIYAFSDQKHGMDPKDAISFGVVLEGNTSADSDDVLVINQNASVMGGISAGVLEPGTHGSVAEAIEFFNKNVADSLVGLNVSRPDEITAKILEIDETLRNLARRSDLSSTKTKQRFSYIGAEISIGVSMAATFALAEALGVPTEVVLNYRYNEYTLSTGLAKAVRPMSIPVNYSVVWEGGKHGVAKYLSELISEGVIQDGSRFPERFKDQALIAKKDKSILLAAVPPQELQIMVLAPEWEQARLIGIKLTKLYQAKLKEHGIKTKYGAESGFTTEQLRDKAGNLIDLDLVLDILGEAVDALPANEAKYVRYALDIAASEMYIPEIDMYYVGPSAAKNADGLVTNEEFTQYKLALFQKYGRFISVEDWATEDEIDHWEGAKAIMGSMIQMGDDNTVSRADMIKKFSAVMNAHLQKPNQSAEEHAGIEAVATSHQLGNVVVTSHRGTRAAQEIYTALAAIGMGTFGAKWTLWGPGRGALIAAMTQANVLYNQSGAFQNVKLPYQGALVLDPNGPYKDYGWAKRVREEIAADEARPAVRLSNSNFKPVNVPQGLVPAVEHYGLKPTKVEVLDLNGEAVPADLLSDKLASFAVGSSIAQAFGSEPFTGLGKGVKEIADGAAVHFSERSLEYFTKRNAKTAVVILGDEGGRDDSFSLPIGALYVDGKKMSMERKSHLYEMLKDLRDEGYQILYFVGDALEHTNGLYRPEALQTPSDSNSLFSFFIDEPGARLNGKDRFFISDYSRIGGTSFSSPTSVTVSPFDLPSVALPKIAKARGEDIATFMNHAIVVTLGPRASEDRKAYETSLSKHRHQAIIKDMNALKKQYPGLTIKTPGDGDLLPRIVSELGLDLDGKRMVTFGRSGANEATAATIVAASLKDARFLHTFVSPNATGSNFSAATAYQYSEEEIEGFKELSIPAEIYNKPRAKRDVKGKGMAAFTSVTGASEGLFGKTFSSIFKRVTFTSRGDKQGEVVTNTLFVKEGGAFIVRTTMATEDLAATKKGLAWASHVGREYWREQEQPARSEVRTLTAEQLQAPMVSFSETLTRLKVSIKGVTGTAKNVTGGLYARTILATASAKAALLEMAANPEERSEIAKRFMATAMMLLGLRGATDSDVFVLSPEFVQKDLGKKLSATAGMRKLYRQASLIAIVTTQDEQDVLGKLNLRLAKQGLEPIVVVDKNDVGALKSHLSRKNAIVRPMLLGGEVLSVELLTLLGKNQIVVTEGMYNRFVDAVSMLVADLVSGLQAKAAMGRSA
ncbi:MAG: glucose-6-phosphate isomerase [Candidatus Omnitrophota bacterium]